jgi:tRNA(Ile)-lysidine synthase
MPRAADPVLAAVTAALDGQPRVVLAVSGGLDSMVLLDAAARIARERIAAVATFDHRSGGHAADLVDHVGRETARRGLHLVVGRAERPLWGEAEWREARWRFLGTTAERLAARVATAHSRDDQLETVCIRILRGAGARGIAGLYTGSATIRPLLDLDRATLSRYASRRRVAWRDDPSNAARDFLRNRVRLDLLPAIRAVDPSFAGEMLGLARRAARLRSEVDDVAADPRISRLRGKRAVELPLGVLQGLAEESLRVLVPALAARAGLILDRRGTTRLAAFILNGRPGASMQLSGGAEAIRARDLIVIRRAGAAFRNDVEWALESEAVGPWRFRRVSRLVTQDVWTAALPLGAQLTVRGWRPGDRMRPAGSLAARRVKRFLRDAGIVGPDRIGWPVVLADGEIVWIPGVRRSDAATERSGRPALRYRCERQDA